MSIKDFGPGRDLVSFQDRKKRTTKYIDMVVPSLSVWQLLLVGKAADKVMTKDIEDAAKEVAGKDASEDEETPSPQSARKSLKSLRSLLSTVKVLKSMGSLKNVEGDDDGDDDEDDDEEIVLESDKEKSTRRTRDPAAMLAVTLAKTLRTRTQKRHYQRWRDNAVQAIEQYNISLVVSDTEDIPLYQQGNMDMYSDENLAQRKELKENRKLQKMINDWWISLPKTLSEELCRMEYIILNMQMNQVLNTGFDVVDARKTADEDWEIDTGGKEEKMKKGQFAESMFNLVDVWTESCELSEYCDFLSNLRENVEGIHDDYGVRKEFMKRRYDATNATYADSSASLPVPDGSAKGSSGKSPRSAKKKPTTKGTGLSDKGSRAQFAGNKKQQERQVLSTAKCTPML